MSFGKLGFSTELPYFRRSAWEGIVLKLHEMNGNECTYTGVGC